MTILQCETVTLLTSCSFVRYFFHQRYFCICGPMAARP